MGRLQSFEQFLSSQSVDIPVAGFIINLFLAAILSLLLSRIYARYGYSLSNRRIFAKNFMMITMTTMLIIAIVKSSLALSLGLVGALSIVRFRAAIKEPEELAYLFLCIAIGLGFGADQRAITFVAFVIIGSIIVLKNYKSRKEESQNLHFVVSSDNSSKMSLDQIVKTLEKYCSAVSLKRFDETSAILEASFLVEFTDFEQLNQSKEELKKIDEQVRVSFLDNRGLI